MRLRGLSSRARSPGRIRRDDVRADGNDFFAQRGSRISRVRAAGENHFARGDGAI